jgi:hypothetical protein
MKKYGTILGLAMAFALVAGPASSGTITIATATVTSTAVNVTGNATFTDRPFFPIAEDGTADATTPAHAQLGGDLTGAAISTTPGGQLRFRWSTAGLPPTGAPPTGIVYGWVFCVSDGDCYELDAGGVNALEQDTDGHGVLWKCATSECVPADQESMTTSVTTVFDQDTDTVTATIPVSAIGAAGRTLVEAGGTLPDVFAGTGDLGLFTYQYAIGDTIDGVEEYTVANKQVSLTLGAPDQDPSTVPYAGNVAVLGNGNFSASLSTAGLTAGSYEVYARACYGLDNCAYASQDVTLA